jgi:hypothetical protein
MDFDLTEIGHGKRDDDIIDTLFRNNQGLFDVVRLQVHWLLVHDVLHLRTGLCMTLSSALRYSTHFRGFISYIGRNGQDYRNPQSQELECA